jgi:hypothetical protein
MKGRVTLYRDGLLLFERENLVVTSGLVALASLLGGVTGGEVVAVVGFGSGNTAPAMGDTGLGSNPAYYNAVGTVAIGPASGVAIGSVQFNYQLLTTDYAANPLTIQELGLFANSAGATFPAAVGTGNPSWTASHAYTVGTLIVDSNGIIQRCTTAGTSGATHPTWATTMSATITDNTAVWTPVALHTAPSPMIAHVVVPSFPYSGGGNYSGTWTISM